MASGANPVTNHQPNFGNTFVQAKPTGNLTADEERTGIFVAAILTGLFIGLIVGGFVDTTQATLSRHAGIVIGYGLIGATIGSFVGCCVFLAREKLNENKNKKL